MGLVGALLRAHPVGVFVAWGATALVGLVVAARLNRAAIVLDPDRLIVRGLLFTTEFPRSTVADAAVDTPQWTMNGPWYLTRGWQDCVLVLEDRTQFRLARLPARGRDGSRPELDKLARTIRAWCG